MAGACGPLTISWTGAVVRPLGLDQAASNSSKILLTPGPQDHGTNLTCRVTFPRTSVSREKTLTLNVSCECGAGMPGGGGAAGRAQALLSSTSHFCVSWGGWLGKGQL